MQVLGEAMRRIERGVQAGLIDETDLTAMEGQIKGDTGKTFGELHRTKFALLRQKIQDAELSNYNRSQQQRELERSKAEAAIIEQLRSQDTITEADIDAAEEKLDEILPGRDSTFLNSIKANQTAEAKSLKEQEEQAKAYADAGLLTTERLSKYHWSIQQKYASVAQMQTGAAPELKEYEDSVVSQVEATVNFDGNAANDGTIDIMKAKAKADFRQLANQYMLAGKSPEEAGALAAAEIRRKLSEGEDNKAGIYYSNETGFPNVLPTAADAKNTLAAVPGEIRRVEATVNALGGKSAFAKTPGLLFSNEQLEEFERQLENGTFSVPPQAAYYAAQYGFKDPLDVIDAQKESSRNGTNKYSSFS